MMWVWPNYGTCTTSYDPVHSIQHLLLWTGARGGGGRHPTPMLRYPTEVFPPKAGGRGIGGHRIGPNPKYMAPIPYSAKFSRSQIFAESHP